MKFVDLVNIRIRSGKGGKGCIAFRREKYVPMGGPSGGDGGRGGDVVFRATTDMSTLLDFKYLDHHEAENGKMGLGSDKKGRDAETLVIPVPVGTLIINAETGELVADMTQDGQTAVVAQGGRGGKGNAHFKSSTHQAPRFAQPGEPGVEMRLTLELKLLADVGLVGLPNAGKSTMISVISAARPKIADYPFTTLVPNLGVVKPEDGRSFVVADIPGLIAGASDGAGLGIQFLRHIERTTVLAHLVDVSDMNESDPVADFKTLMAELEAYSPELAGRTMIVVGTKTDACLEGERLGRLHEYCANEGYVFYPVSAVTGDGVRTLVKALEREVHKG
jgi:GTP-binding protein